MRGKMNIRPFLLCLLALLFPLQAWSQSSGRKIGPVDVGYVEPSSLSVSRDGRFLALLSIPGEKGSDCIVIDRRTHQTHLLPGSSRAEPLCFSHDGVGLWIWGLHLDERLPGLRVEPCGQEFLALYDLKRQRYTRSFQLADSDEGVVGDSVLSRDGRTLIYSTGYGWIVGVSTRTGKQKWKRRVQDEGNDPVSVELSADGSRFLRMDDEGGEGQSAQVVSTRTGRVLSTLQLQFASPQGMRSAFESGHFAPRGSMVALFQQDTQQWAFFDSDTAQLKWKMGGPSRASEGDLKWQWSPDARFVGVTGPRGLEVRDARSGRVLRVCPQLQGDALTFSPDGLRVYALANNETGFGLGTVLWQWRLFPTKAQRRADARIMRRVRSRENRFALSRQHITASLCIAARRGDATRIAFLLAHGAAVDARFSRQETALSTVAHNFGSYDGPRQFLACAHVLLAHGANVHARDVDGETALSSATTSAPMLKLLLEHGAGADGHSVDLNNALLWATRCHPDVACSWGQRQRSRHGRADTANQHQQLGMVWRFDGQRP